MATTQPAIPTQQLTTIVSNICSFPCTNPFRIISDFVAGFLKLFPEFAYNRFFVAGESYAGHYVPQLALLLFRAGIPQRFEGFLAGNPSTDHVYDRKD